MLKTKLNNLLLEYTKEKITPQKDEWSFVSDKYEELLSLLENKNCFQSGSCARFTSIKPINDLDVVWIISDEIKKAINSDTLDLQNVLEDLAKKIEEEYKKIGVKTIIKPQTHSVGIYFSDNESEFSIDIVPAKNTGQKNEFGDYILEVPEILFYSKKNRTKIYKSKKKVDWRKSDPKGYKEEIKKLHEKNDNLRKVIRFLKKWRWNCKKNYPNFPIKSFHLELIVKDIFETNNNITFLEAIEEFHKDIMEYFKAPYFLDRADDNVYVDDYVKDINIFDKNEIHELSKLFLNRLSSLEKIDNNNIDSDIELLLSARDDEEKFIHDEEFSYTVAINEDINFQINGKVSLGKRTKKDTISNYPLRQNNCTVKIGKSIEFYISEDVNMNNCDYYWKVKNRGENNFQDGIRVPRGEITLNQTYQNPEQTAYNGVHFVECFVINNGKCIAYDRVYVNIQKN